MRIISQNGAIDVPYEQVSIEIKENGIWCGYYATLAQHCISKKFAEYSSKEKAEKAMEMLREKYKDYARATNKSNFFTMFDYPKVFRFPSDEDVEV